MAFSIQTQLKIQVGSTAYFNFDDPVLNYMVGLSGFHLERSGDDHHVRSLSIDLQVSKTGTNQVTVKAQAVMDDNGGHGLSPGRSYIDVVLLANTQMAQSGLLLTNVNGISSGGQGQPLTDLPVNPVFQSAVVSGFNLSYGSSTDHHVKDLQVSVGITSPTTSGTSATVTGLASMTDGSGNGASTATLNAGVIAENHDYQQAGFFETIGFNSQNNQLTGTLASRNPSPVFATLVQAFEVAYSGSDHHVLAIDLGTSVASTAGASPGEFDFTVTSAISMKDGTGNKSDPGKSWISGLVICN